MEVPDDEQWIFVNVLGVGMGVGVTKTRLVEVKVALVSIVLVYLVRVTVGPVFHMVLVLVAVNVTVGPVFHKTLVLTPKTSTIKAKKTRIIVNIAPRLSFGRIVIEGVKIKKEYARGRLG